MIHHYPKLNLPEIDGGDTGAPLFLTPYIERGNITEGRRLARVPFTESLGFKSYAGYFTVNKQYDSNQFFWYFPAIVPNKDAPVIVWLQGGPGATSLFGLFTENGPLRVHNGKFEKRKYNWALGHHVIYIDNPVGTGFSFTKNPKGYCTNQTQAKVFADSESKVVELIKNKQWLQAFKSFDSLLNGDLINGKSMFYNMTGFEFYFNFLHTKDYFKKEDFGPMIQKSYVRKAIHVGNLSFHDGSIVEENLKEDVMQSVAPWISELLDHYYVLVYNGQLDIIVAYPNTLNYLRNLNFTGADDYKTAKRYHWLVDNELAGYVKQGGKLVEIMVRDAGHMVPGDQPKWALDMITRLTHEKTFTNKKYVTF
ncbi:unnamed protein product [Leptidea sinapis]|uniref:Carboxypeptidase n=1 Tax=Leptidea sinapis TaxID=189913 RepID=A0A5E4Q308_9NEOP|nr:unnamed protein product [Leptidea sinapis]